MITRIQQPCQSHSEHVGKRPPPVFVLDEPVVKIDPLANRSTHWSVG